MLWLFPFIQGRPLAGDMFFLFRRRMRSLSSSLRSFVRHVSCSGLTDPCRWWRRTADGTDHRVVRCRCRMSASAAGARVGTAISSMDQNRFRQVEASGAADASGTAAGPSTASRCNSGTNLLSRVARSGPFLPPDHGPAIAGDTLKKQPFRQGPRRGGNGGTVLRDRFNLSRGP